MMEGNAIYTPLAQWMTTHAQRSTMLETISCSITKNTLIVGTSNTKYCY